MKKMKTFVVTDRDLMNGRKTSDNACRSSEIFWLKKYKQAVYRIHKLFILSKFPLILLLCSLRQANVVKIMVKSLGTLAFLGCFPIHACPTLPLPSPHKQHWTRVYRNFPSFNFV